MTQHEHSAQSGRGYYASQLLRALPSNMLVRPLYYAATGLAASASLAFNAGVYVASKFTERTPVNTMAGIAGFAAYAASWFSNFGGYPTGDYIFYGTLAAGASVGLAAGVENLWRRAKSAFTGQPARQVGIIDDFVLGRDFLDRNASNSNGQHPMEAGSSFVPTLIGIANPKLMRKLDF